MARTSMPTKATGILNGPTMVTARRALGITKTYIVMAFFFSVLAIAVWGNVMYVGSSTGTPVLAVPLDMIPLLMLATPVVLLFVYDKNNGVLEYVLSLGMTQRDIYTRYLKAALLLTFAFSVIFAPPVLAYTYATQGAGTVATILPIPLVAIPFALAAVAFMVTAMMAFSSLQKTRAGSNQPLGLIVGWLVTIPGYLVPFIFSFEAAIYADLAIAAIIAVVVFIFLMSSGKLIRREKFLP
jgi:hypothetical protein